MNHDEIRGWGELRHGGMLLDPQRLQEVAAAQPDGLTYFLERDLRKRTTRLLDSGERRPSDITDFVSFVFNTVCGFTETTGSWQRGPQVSPEWGRVAITGETVKPRQLWQGPRGGMLPVFIEREKRVGIGRGRRLTSQVLQWLRSGQEQLALVTNGYQWRLVFAGLDFDAWCEWDIDLWLEEGELSPQITALRTLLQPTLWTPAEEAAPTPLLQAILDSRKGQAELSQILGERVREAVEILVQGHGDSLKEQCNDVNPADIYRAAVRVVMRLVVVLFAESRELLPRGNTVYHDAYGLGGLLEELEKTSARGGGRLSRSWNAWPRVLALFNLVHQGSHHPDLPVPAYGGELFAPGHPESPEGLTRALAVFENACFDHEAISDRDVQDVLERITRTRVKLRQGRASTWVPAPVDFSDLSSEYIGILYEGLLDFELKTAPGGDPVIFLAVGNQPALPLSRLEAMDNNALKNLLDKLKDTSSSDDEASATDGDTDMAAMEGEQAPVDMPEEEFPAVEETESAGEEEDERHTTRARAEAWARRAVEISRLAKKPRGRMTPEKKLAFEETIARKARQLVTRVVLPGEWYLVRWGGTRKGSGTFYTRPGLAVPTVQRTLRPLAWSPPSSTDGEPEFDAPHLEWVPKKPEEILHLKVVDPACGSGTFPVSALRFLTDSLYASLHHHGRIHDRGDRALVVLLTGSTSMDAGEEPLCEELLPCRPSDELFEPRLKAVLRRHVVERCIYGIDLDPLAAELCRLALWVETMDRALPFSFLDHKVKCGNGLVGAWFDQFQHYPIMAFKNREGGDKMHSNGMHFKKNAQTKAIKAFVKDVLTPDLADTITGQKKLEEAGVEDPQKTQDEALAVLEELHGLPVVDTGDRARFYRERLVGSARWQELKSAFDRWCACWFWPTDRLDCAPLPSRFAAPSVETIAVATEMAAEKRFFHWELEFPDVFHAAGSGFDAVLGNPPWEIAKPNSKEFFSRFDPLYRGIANPESRQRELFAEASVESAWIDYNDGYAAWSNFVRYSSYPFGDPKCREATKDRFAIARGAANQELHSRWRGTRATTTGYAIRAHPYRFQGGGDLNLYKLFVEQMLALLVDGGRLGVVLPSAIYNDHGTATLRGVLIDGCRLEWIFGFENRRKIFPIDSRFRFCCLIAERGAPTRNVKVAFGRLDIEHWEQAVGVFSVEKRDLSLFSPISKSVPEIEDPTDLELLRATYLNKVLIGDSESPWRTKYVTEFHMTTARKKGLFTYVENALDASAEAIAPGHWLSNGKRFVVLYTGKMIAQYDFAYQQWKSGHGKQAEWESMPFTSKSWQPEFVMPISNAKHRWSGGTRLVFRDITNATNERTAIASIVPAWPCGNKVPVIADEGTATVFDQLALCSVMNSFVYDFVVRSRMTGINLNKFILAETAIPPRDAVPSELAVVAAQLAMCHEVFACAWLDLLGHCPDLEARSWAEWWAVKASERIRLRALVEAVVAFLYGVSEDQFRWLLRDCDWPVAQLSKVAFRSGLPPKGFWRVGVGSAEHELRRAWACDPELRLPVLAVVAFLDLQKLVADYPGNFEKAVAAFVQSNNWRGWELPETLTLTDYGMGRDDRASEPQVVRRRLEDADSVSKTTPTRSWDECRSTASQLQSLWSECLADLPGGADRNRQDSDVNEESNSNKNQRSLFD